MALEAQTLRRASSDRAPPSSERCHAAGYRPFSNPSSTSSISRLRIRASRRRLRPHRVRRQCRTGRSSRHSAERPERRRRVEAGVPDSIASPARRCRASVTPRPCSAPASTRSDEVSLGPIRVSSAGGPWCFFHSAQEAFGSRSCRSRSRRRSCGVEGRPCAAQYAGLTTGYSPQPGCRPCRPRARPQPCRPAPDVCREPRLRQARGDRGGRAQRLGCQPSHANRDRGCQPGYARNTVRGRSRRRPAMTCDRAGRHRLREEKEGGLYP